MEGMPESWLKRLTPEARTETGPVRAISPEEVRVLLSQVSEEDLPLIRELNEKGVTGGADFPELFARINAAEIRIPMEDMRAQAHTDLLELPRRVVRVSVSADGILSVADAA